MLVSIGGIARIEEQRGVENQISNTSRGSSLAFHVSPTSMAAWSNKPTFVQQNSPPKMTALVAPLDAFVQRILLIGVILRKQCLLVARPFSLVM